MEKQPSKAEIATKYLNMWGSDRVIIFLDLYPAWREKGQKQRGYGVWEKLDYGAKN